MSGDTILRVHALAFAYTGQAALFADFSARIGPGVTLIHGDTGSGKTTLLRLMAGAVAAAAGRFTLGGVALGDNAEAYRHRVFYCDPTTDAFEQHTARDRTAVLAAGDTGFDSTGWQSLVDGFALAPHLDKPLYMLSTGSKRKTFLAAALASGCPLVLLDEPTGGLDAASVACLWNALARCAEQRDGRAVVVASTERVAKVAWTQVIDLAGP